MASLRVGKNSESAVPGMVSLRGCENSESAVPGMVSLRGCKNSESAVAGLRECWNGEFGVFRFRSNQFVAVHLATGLVGEE